MPLLFSLLLLYVTACNCCSTPLKKECTPTQRSYCYCKNSTLVCCNIFSNSAIKDAYNCSKSKYSVTKVRIYNATIEKFDLKLEEWTKLESLSITEGRISKFQGRFNAINLTCMNLSGNGIIDIGPETFTRLHELRTLDISRNNLTKIPNILLHKKKEFNLDISSTKMWCKDIHELLTKLKNNSLNTNLIFMNNESTRCLTNRSFHWFNSTDFMLLSQIQRLTMLDDACPSSMNSSCTCRVYRADYVSINTELKFVVNCSYLQLTELPPLPANTIYLDVSNNEIRSLELLSTNKNYSAVRGLNADNNKIESIATLEGSTFIDNFDVLSLRNNQIKFIPTYILSNAFDRNTFHHKVVKFGENRLNCDCGTASVKMWLLNNKNYIVDFDEVQCDKEFQRVIDIDPSHVCIHEEEENQTDYIYYIIAGELLFLLLLVSKVSYDYWVFTSSGYLPWPASKMPKLPCDWCFES